VKTSAPQVVMFPFRKILVPVDYSGSCEAVIPYFKEITQRFSASVTLVHAYGLTDPGLPEEARRFEEERLREFAVEKFPG